MKMLEVGEFALLEIHEHCERRLGLDEKPLLVQLSWLCSMSMPIKHCSLVAGWSTAGRTQGVAQHRGLQQWASCWGVSTGSMQ